MEGFLRETGPSPISPTSNNKRTGEASLPGRGDGTPICASAAMVHVSQGSGPDTAESCAWPATRQSGWADSRVRHFPLRGQELTFALDPIQY